MERIICLVIGYACGLLQSGYLVGKMHHIDIRKAGSGNSGSTNALRVMGLKAGLMTFAGDVLKCFAALLIVRAIYHGSNILPLLMMYAGAGVTLGHNFPFYMNFKGGKGIAVMAVTCGKQLFLASAVQFNLVFCHTGILSCAGACDKICFPWFIACLCSVFYPDGDLRTAWMV